jgi:hypothetical protein
VRSLPSKTCNCPLLTDMTGGMGRELRVSDVMVSARKSRSSYMLANPAAPGDASTILAARYYVIITAKTCVLR